MQGATDEHLDQTYSPGVKQLAFAMQRVYRKEVVEVDVGGLLVAVLELGAKHHHETCLNSGGSREKC